MKFNKNEFGWKEKVSVNTDELVTKNDIPHYNETLMFEISGDDYRFFRNESYFNMDALNIDETKLYVGKEKFNINFGEEYNYKFVYDKETDALIDNDNQLYIYNHKSYDGTNFTDDVNSAVITFGITPMVGTKAEGYFRLYEVEKLELDSKCLPDDLNIGNSLTVGNRIGDIGKYSVVEGFENTASGILSHAEGYSTTASGECSHAEGSGTTASGHYAHAEGESSNSINAVISNFSPSTSNDVILTAWNENSFSLAKGESSHVEGMDNLALGNFSHAEGASTTASGTSSHTEGTGTTASGNLSHAEGEWTTASGYASHAEGCDTKASSDYQHVQGQYNIEDTENRYLHIVGNGSSDTERSNAHTLDWQGNGWYKGKISQDGTPTEDKDLTTKKYVDDTIANQPQISFDTEGNLVVTIGGVTKKFKEITE